MIFEGSGELTTTASKIEGSISSVNINGFVHGFGYRGCSRAGGFSIEGRPLDICLSTTL